MTKKDNLYSEVVINESPFYYDEHGRLRAHVLSEESIRGPEKGEEVMVPAVEPKTPPTPTTQNKPKKKLGGIFGKLKNKQGLGPTPAKGSGDDGMVRISPIERPRDGMVSTMPVRRKQPLPVPAKGSGDDDRGGMVFAGGGNKKDGSSHERINAPKITDMRARPPSNIRRPLPARGQPVRPIGGRPGLGRNTNVKPQRPVPSLRPGGAPLQRAALEESKFTSLIERLNLQKAEMGEVIKDFQKSDAPQFKGKSDKKRRIMAIAAKLQADRTK